jgi:alkanesulfonate monooxygenase
VPDPQLASSWEHCRNIVLRAEEGGFDNILLPSGYSLGLDTTAFAAAVATQVRRIKLLWATRMGEDWPPQLARRIATLDRILGPDAAGTGGRLNLNIISSDMPGEKIESGPRYARATEIMKIVRTLLNGESLDFQGEFYKLKLDPPRITTLSGKCPAFYFGGLSHEARECAAESADVYLMWPDTMDKVRETVADMTARAAARGRTLKFGYRAHVIVRETEDEARAYADRLLSKLDEDAGKAIREKSLDAKNYGVQRQQELRGAADGDGFVEDNLWTGISRARSGCGAAIVGTPDQVIAKLRAYQEAGMEAFILSGYPHVNECDMFARYVLPQLQHGPLTI